MSLPSPPPGPLDFATMAVFDLMHQLEYFRDNFGGRELAGVASIVAGTKNLTGVGTSWATGDDSLAAGERVLLGFQVAEITGTPTDGALTIKIDHADGMTSETIFKVGRGFRHDTKDVFIDVGGPYWFVAADILPPLTPGVSRKLSTYEVAVTIVYERPNIPLKDSEGSWAGILYLILDELSTDEAQSLRVSRFGLAPLARRITGWDPGRNPLQVEGQPLAHVIAPQLTVSWQAEAPEALKSIVQRW